MRVVKGEVCSVDQVEKEVEDAMMRQQGGDRMMEACCSLYCHKQE